MVSRNRPGNSIWRVYWGFRVFSSLFQHQRTITRHDNIKQTLVLCMFCNSCSQITIRHDMSTQNTVSFQLINDDANSLNLTKTKRSFKTRSHVGVTNGEIKNRNFDFYKMTWYCKILQDTNQVIKIPKYYLV